MGDNVKYNEKCIKGNIMYYKIMIDQMIDYEINKLGADEAPYQKLNITVTSKLEKFSEKLILGSDFNENMTKLRDEIITDCTETNNSSSGKMRPYFKDYIFDKIYTMGINIKKGLLPDDYEQELEEARLKAEEEKEKEKLEQENEINIKIEDETVERQPDLIDQMWNYFFPSSKVDNKAGKDKDKTKEKESEGKQKSEEVKDKVKFN